MSKSNILVVDDDQIILDSLAEFLRLEGHSVTPASSFKQGAREMHKTSYSLVIMDVNLPDGDGMDLLEAVKRSYPETVVIMITGYGTIESAVESIKKGAYDYLTKPIIDDELLLAVERGLRQHNLMSENKALRSQLEQKYSLDSFVSQDYKMSRVFELVEAVADTNTSVLIQGESGTGKSMLARAMHYRSAVSSGPFVEVSCGALPEALLESELFGHVRGAFTGAVDDKGGKFVAAKGGTLFLDEIATASPAMQVRLLRVLQNREFEPVGSNQTLTSDARVIFASNRDLAEEVRAGRFREDLFYRINVVAVTLPTLAERMADIPLLANDFLRRYGMTHSRAKKGISEAAMEKLQRYPWPGNVRELENVIERAVLLGKNAMVETEDLPPHIVEHAGVGASFYDEGVSLKDALAGPERGIIRAALEKHGWNRQVTADALMINRTTLYKKMKKYGLEDEAQRLGL